MPHAKKILKKKSNKQVPPPQSPQTLSEEQIHKLTHHLVTWMFKLEQFIIKKYVDELEKVLGEKKDNFFLII